MLQRRVTTEILEALDTEPAVALIGPRQVGKTTLAIEIGQQRDALYLDLEDRNDREKLSEPRLYLEPYEDRLVILDEIHRVPELFQDLRGIIDQGRRRGRRSGRFLILGSASIDLLRQSGESLAGRISYIEMGPLSALEVPESDSSGLGSHTRLWLRGGFPEAYLAETDRQSLQRRKNFIRTYLERDVPQFGPRIPAETLERLWVMLAHSQGTPLNASKLAASLAVSVQSVTRYIDLLSDLLLVRRLRPYHTNTSKRLVKSPKIYVRDSGLTHALLGIPDYDALLGHPVAGMSWEGFVIETLITLAPWNTQASFYRTAAGAEIDLLLEFPGGEQWAIEIKRALSAKLERGFYSAKDDLRPTRSFVVHAGTDRYTLARDIEAIGLRELADMLAAM